MNTCEHSLFFSNRIAELSACIGAKAYLLNSDVTLKDGLYRAAMMVGFPEVKEENGNPLLIFVESPHPVDISQGEHSAVVSELKGRLRLIAPPLDPVSIPEIIDVLDELICAAQS